MDFFVESTILVKSHWDPIFGPEHGFHEIQPTEIDVGGSPVWGLIGDDERPMDC